jgi:hypothetical protein
VIRLAAFVGRRSDGAVEPWEIVVPNVADIQNFSSIQLPEGQRGPTISEGVEYASGDARTGHHDTGASTRKLRRPRDRHSPPPRLANRHNDDAWRVQEAISDTVQALVHDAEKNRPSEFVRASSWRTPRPPQQIAAAARRQLQSDRSSTYTKEDKMMKRARHVDGLVTRGGKLQA